MTRTIHGRVHGKAIELDEDLGLPDGQEVAVTVNLVEPPQPPRLMGDGLAKIYAILGERYSTGCADTAERPNEHRP